MRNYVLTTSLAIKGAMLLFLSSQEVQAHALTYDFAIFYQAAFLISRGNISPYSSVAGYPFYQDHFSLALWPIAPLLVLWNSPLVLKLVQDTCTLGANAVALVWIRRLIYTQHSEPSKLRTLLMSLAVAITIFDPWTFYNDAFDFHLYSFMGFCFVSSAYCFYLRKPILGSILAFASTLAGDVALTILVGFSISILLARPRAYPAGGILALIGLGGLIAIHRLGLDAGSGTGSGYGYLVGATPSHNPSAVEVVTGILMRPANTIQALWSMKLRAYANLAPSGFLGILSPWAVGTWSVLLAENLLHSGGYDKSGFSLPGVQFEPGYDLLAVGEVWFICFIVRGERWKYIIASLSLANAALWALIWLPHLPAEWLRSSESVDAKLDLVQNLIPAQAPVISSPGVIGAFAARPFIKAFIDPGQYTLQKGDNYLLFTPYTGIEQPPEVTTRAISCLLTDHDATPLLASDSLWLFRISARANHSIQLAMCDRYFASAFVSDVGYRDTDANAFAAISTASNDSSGYLLRDAFFRRPTGSYRFSITTESSIPVIAEIWDAVRKAEITRREIGGTSKKAVWPIDFSYRAKSDQDQLFSGYGPFVVPQLKLDHFGVVELRVWTPIVRQATLSLIKVSAVPR